MRKNKERIQGVIKQIDSNGTGSFYHGNDKISVRNVLLNEKVEVEVVKRIKDGYVANVIKVLQAHKDRVKPNCSFFHRCGSCQLLHVNYSSQLQMKKQWMIALVKQNNMNGLTVMDCVGMEHPYAYRNKIIISFGKIKNEVVAGFYEEFSHKIIPISACLLHEEYTNHLIESLKQIVKKCKIEIYDEDARRGFLRHILLRRGMHTNQTMIVIVGAEKIFKAKNNFLKQLRLLHPEIDTVVLNVNTRKTSVVLADYEQVLYGKGYIEDILCGYRFKISSRSFYQINHEQCEKLYEKAIALLGLKGNEAIVDAYSGVGTIGLIIANKAKNVYSVELNKDAVSDAIQNAKRNQIKNVLFKCDDAGRFLSALAYEKKKIDAVILDPAREGSDEQFLSSLIKLNPAKIIYISCNPQTQIRDLKYLQKFGYQGEKMYLYDLFPNTYHIESIMKLVKK